MTKNEQVFENQDMVTIVIRRKNNVYQLKVFIELGYTKEGNMWYGTERPRRQLMENDDNWINIDGNTYMVSKDLYTTYLDEEEPENAVIDDLWFGGD